MIVTVILYILSYFLTIITVILPTWQIWPDSLLNGVVYLSTQVAVINWLLPVSDLFTVFLFVIQFEIYYQLTRIAVMVFNYFRGTGGGIEI